MSKLQLDKESKIYLGVIGAAAVLLFVVYFILKPANQAPPVVNIKPSNNRQTIEQEREALLRRLVTPSTPVKNATSSDNNQTNAAQQKDREELLKRLVTPKKK